LQQTWLVVEPILNWELELLMQVDWPLLVLSDMNHVVSIRQLRGRSGRQGDPGSTNSYVSLEDNLMRLFGSERIAQGYGYRMGI
jgi:hypothetical protein